MARLGESARSRLRLWLWENRPHICHLCGEPIERLTELDADHLEAYVDNPGADQLDPAAYAMAHGVRAAGRCNQRRGAMPLERWATYRPIDQLARFGD